MNIYIEIEVLKRELNSKLLLALELINREHIVYLISRDNLNYLAKNKKIQPGVIFLKDMNSQINRINDYKFYFENKFVLVSQDEEIGCFKDENFEDFFNGRFKGKTSKAFNYIDRYFCWGDFDYDFLKNYSFHTKFVNSGSARMDLCKLLEHEIFNKKKKILVSLNQNIFWKRNFIERVNIEINDNLDDQHLSKLLSKMFENESKDLILTLHLINLIRELNKINIFDIIIRPHPAMDLKEVNSIFNNKKLFNNVKVSNNGALIEQIVKSDILLHFGCTSGIEATLNNKSTICFYPNINYLENYKKSTFLNKIGFNFSDEKKLIKFFKNFENNQAEIIKKLIHDRNQISQRVKIDGQSFKRIANEICLFSTNKNLNINNSDNVFKNINIKNILKKIIKKYIFKRKNGESAFEVKFPVFNYNEIKSTIDDLNKLSSINTSYKLTKLNERCIKLSK